jgi:hypothetical protein
MNSACDSVARSSSWMPASPMPKRRACRRTDGHCGRNRFDSGPQQIAGCVSRITRISVVPLRPQPPTITGRAVDV